MTTQLVHSTGARFDVLGSATGGRVWLRRVGGIVADGLVFSRDYLELHFTAYPPQEQPDRVDRLAEETDGWEPLTAYRKTFCPADDKELEPGYRVVEAYAGALVDALFCGTCNRHYSADTLTEIKLWKD